MSILMLYKKYFVLKKLLIILILMSFLSGISGCATITDAFKEKKCLDKKDIVIRAIFSSAVGAGAGWLIGKSTGKEKEGLLIGALGGLAAGSIVSLTKYCDVQTKTREELIDDLIKEGRFIKSEPVFDVSVEVDPAVVKPGDTLEILVYYSFYSPNPEDKLDFKIKNAVFSADDEDKSNLAGDYKKGKKQGNYDATFHYDIPKKLEPGTYNIKSTAIMETKSYKPVIKEISKDFLVTDKEDTGDIVKRNIVRITGNGVRIRKGPSTSYAVIGSANVNDSFEKLGESGDWVKIRINNSTEGWIHRNYVADAAIEGQEI